MRRREILPLWELDYIEGDLNYNTGRCREALQHYGAALKSRHVQDNDTLQMELLHRQISCYDGLHNESSKMRCVKQLMSVAKKSGHRPMESIALFNMGKSLYYQGDKDRDKAEAEECYKLFCKLDNDLSRNNYLIWTIR